MIVAISLAFTSTYVTKFDFNSILSFIFANTVVIWFWWGYVIDRLSFPPRTMRFPLLDILVLILISLLPFALREGRIYYLSADVGALVIIWALMIQYIIRENEDTILPDVMRELRAEVRQRLIIGPIFVLSAVLGVISNLVGLNVFVVLVVIIIGWTAFTRRRRKKKPTASTP